MEKKCFDCGKPVMWVGSGPGFLNSEQWDAIKAGDWYAPCENATHENGNCYFTETSGVSSLKPKPLTNTGEEG